LIGDNIIALWPATLHAHDPGSIRDGQRIIAVRIGIELTYKLAPEFVVYAKTFMFVTACARLSFTEPLIGLAKAAFVITCNCSAPAA